MEEVRIIRLKQVIQFCYGIELLVLCQDQLAKSGYDFKLAGETAEGVLEHPRFHLQVDYLSLLLHVFAEHTGFPCCHYLNEQAVIEAGKVLLLDREACLKGHSLQQRYSDLVEQRTAELSIVRHEKR